MNNTSENTAAATGLLVRVLYLFPAPSSCIPVYPLIYHSISEEIPDASRPLITRLYQLWLVLLATLFINMLACIFVLVAGASDGGKDLGGSIGYALLFPSDHNSSHPPKATCSSSLPSPSSCGTGELIPSHVRPTLTPTLRPIYNGYMKVRTIHPPFHTLLDVLFRNKPYIIVRLIIISPLARPSTFARLVLFLLWFPPAFQCLYVGLSPFLSLTSSLSLQDHRHSQYWFCWSHPNYSNVLPRSLGRWHSRNVRHCWLDPARRWKCFLLPPGLPHFFRSHPTDN